MRNRFSSQHWLPPFGQRFAIAGGPGAAIAGGPGTRWGGPGAAIAGGRSPAVRAHAGAKPITLV